MAFTNQDIFWLFLILPVFLIALVVFRFFYGRNKKLFADSELFETLSRSISKTKRGIRNVLLFFGLLFLIISMAGPRFGTKTEIVKRMGLDMVVAIDTSYSMLAEDVKPNRIMQAKFEINNLIESLKGDRIAFVVFAGDSYVQCPLTSDYGAAKTLLENVDAGIVPVPGTNIETAINKSTALLKKTSEAGSQSQIILLITDGENLSGNFESAARKAASMGIRIFTIGVGTSSGEIIPIKNERGEVSDYKKDSSGNVVKTSLNENSLKTIANITNGAYLKNENGEANVQAIIDEIGSMQKSNLHERKISRLKERYQIPLCISLLFLLSWYVIGERKRKFE